MIVYVISYKGIIVDLYVDLNIFINVTAKPLRKICVLLLNNISVYVKFKFKKTELLKNVLRSVIICIYIPIKYAYVLY